MKDNKLNYKEAIDYLTAKGIECNPCQSEEGEYTQELLRELYNDEDNDDERYNVVFIDEILNILLASRRSIIE